MSSEIITLRLPFPLGITTVNSYLVKNENGFFLVDTGMTNARRRMEAELDRLGCKPGDLKLIIITHGDFDHTGNAIYLRQKYAAKIAMHADDVGMLENGDMFYHRKFENRLLRGLMKTLLPFKRENRGKPDILLEDGASLVEYGLDAVVYNTPGHSTGSICILTAAGDLFAGDLLSNSSGTPMLNSMMYDKEAGAASLARLKTLPIRKAYSGHGDVFDWKDLAD